MMFTAPADEKELQAALSQADERTYLIAGGTDLLIHLQNRKETDCSFIDLTKVKELQGIREEKDWIDIGALVTMTELCASPLVKEELRALYLAAYHLGSEQIRNRATLGGAIANASQSSDCSVVLFAYGALVEIFSAQGERRKVPMDQFITGREKTCLDRGEAVSRILIPRQERSSMFGKVGARKAVTIAKINCAMDFRREEGLIQKVSIYLGAVGVKPVEARLLENYFQGKSFAEIALQDVQELGKEEVEKAIPTRPSRFYKRVAVQGLLEDMIGALP